MVRVAFVHLDLGIGGAERLICDAALALQKKGHNVVLYTSHHDPNHCFKETKDGTLQVKCLGDWLPRQTLGRFYAFWAYVRMIFVAIHIVFVSPCNADVFFCDQVSACIPFLRLSGKPVVFYCHFPDMLLTQRKSFLKKLYRFPIDFMEQYTTGLADKILVNSHFTESIFHSTFKSLTSTSPVVLYPSLNLRAFDEEQTDEKYFASLLPATRSIVFLSINRYERKKDLSLALKALGQFTSSQRWKNIHLIMAGGYDEQNVENKEHFTELESLATDLNISDHVTFVKSFNMEEKVTLLKHATALLYTPTNEHFGIVPIEAMYMKCPVIACNSGGPRETVQHTKTGFLMEPTEESFASAMKEFVDDPELRVELGRNGQQRVVENFSFNAFSKSLHNEVTNLHRLDQQSIAAFVVLFLICFSVGFYVFIYFFMK